MRWCASSMPAVSRRPSPRSPQPSPSRTSRRLSASSGRAILNVGRSGSIRRRKSHPHRPLPFLWELASQLLIQPPHGRFPLRVVSLHLFVLGPSDGGHGLILRCAARNLLLNGVAHIHQHLPEAAEPLSSFSRVCRNRSMSRHENVGSKRFDRI